MAIGMPRNEFWYGDPDAAREYRTAYRLERDSKDYWAWRQGAYVYEAILDVAPILRAFSKAKRPEKYPDKPYGFGSEKAEEQEQKKPEISRGQLFMETFAASWNKKFKEKEAVKNGGEHEGQRT